MPIDPELDAYHAAVTAAVPPASPCAPAARRARLEAVARRFPYPRDAVARQDHWIHLSGRELLVRIYRPRDGALPAILYLHGGGWMAGSVDSHDGACAALAIDADAIVASVQYRRAPENPWPAPNDDAYDALLWLARSAGDLGVDAARVAVGGDSAGAHLAIGVAIEARDRRGPPIALQLLIYPVVEPDFETTSYREHAISATLTRADMIDYWNAYLPQGTAVADTRALPGRGALRGLPPAHIVVAGCDPLHDEGVRFAEQLQQEGVAAMLIDAPSMTHGFLRAAPYVREARAVQQAFGRAAGIALRT
ncbi:MAG: alpha/beta hydrolase [Betaproteobacteria bacterium]